MSIGIFTGTIKSIDRKPTQEGDFTCTVWLNIPEFKSQPLRATAWNELGRSMESLKEGDTITISGTIDIESIDRPSIKKKILAIPKILQFTTLNQVVLVGRAGANPKVQRFDATDTREESILATFDLAVKSRREDPNWYPLEIWGRTAEIVEEYVQTGSLIEVIGTIKVDTWQDRNTGDDRAKPVVCVDRIQLLSSKRDDSDESITESSASSPSTSESVEVTPKSVEEQPSKRRKRTSSDKPKKQVKSESTELLTQSH